MENKQQESAPFGIISRLRSTILVTLVDKGSRKMYENAMQSHKDWGVIDDWHGSIPYSFSFYKYGLGDEEYNLIDESFDELEGKSFKDREISSKLDSLANKLHKLNKQETKKC